MRFDKLNVAGDQKKLEMVKERSYWLIFVYICGCKMYSTTHCGRGFHYWFFYYLKNSIASIIIFMWTNHHSPLRPAVRLIGFHSKPSANIFRSQAGGCVPQITQHEAGTICLHLTVPCHSTSRSSERPTNDSNEIFKRNYVSYCFLPVA